MSTLSRLACTVCDGDTPPLTSAEAAHLSPEVPEWRILERDGIMQLERTFRFRDFAQALAFTNRVGDIAEAQGHHPALTTEWGKTTVIWWTHTLRGLHRNDFIMAARTDELAHSHAGDN
ncbi:4a-hydroxytetrahydrobiopterin dehydratase [Salinicola avicenniae]|uniref:4a-hydroxytetrahydrobiopterin dehydratase n=1 Tax=Salinicola avicenniae TaxID=2916836 RepID=UPI0020743169|nr:MULTISPECIES: 4a-hydroxytetrahydrobiopterin dehydratase [unclassified Salinicola]